MAKKSTSVLDDAPTAGEILGLYTARLTEGDEDRLRSRAATAREQTEMRHRVSIPETYRAIAKEIRTPFVRDTWLRVTAALTRDTPVSHVEARDITEPARNAANIAERFFLATVQAMNRERGEDLLYENVKALVRDQESVIKCVHKSDAWAAFPKRQQDESVDVYDKRVENYKKGAPMVFASRVVDRLSMLFGDGEYGDAWALEYGEYPLPYLKKRYGMVAEDGTGTGYYMAGEGKNKAALSRQRLVDPKDAISLLGGRPAAEGDLATSGPGMCVKVEYWDEDVWCVVIDGTMAPGFPKRNPYAPKLPYFRAKSDPVLYALSFLVPGFDSLLTMWLNWAYIGAYPTPQLVAPANSAPSLGDIGGEMEPGGDANTKVAIWSPGKQVEPPPGYEVRFLQPPPIGQDVQQMAQIYRQLIETAGVASVLRGAAGSDYSGYLASQLISAATLTYKHLGNAVEAQFAQMGEFMWHVVTNKIKQEVYVLATEKDGRKDVKHWLGLKPTGKVVGLCAPIDMLARMEVQLRPVLPTDEQAAAMIGNQANAAGLLPKRRVLEKYYQEEDPEGLLDELVVERALDTDPMLMQLQTTEALRKAGYLPAVQSGLLDQNGQPMASGQQNGLSPFPPGQAAGGLPGVPGLTQPLQPAPPVGPGMPGMGGGRPAGAFPGAPSNQGPPV